MNDLLKPFPRIKLGHWPTPLHPLPRLSEHLAESARRPDVWIKRDDLSSLGLGGNKARKLEFLLGRAKAQGAGTIITVGGVQSNHACQTAAACAALGLDCHLILVRVVPGRGDSYETSGNIPVEHMFGAQVHIVDDDKAALETLGPIMEKAEAGGRPAFLIPAGGSTAIGALGFVNAAFELQEQERSLGLTFDRIVLATSTAGTAAGLATGLGVADAERPIDAVMVYEPAEALGPILNGLITQTSELLDVSAPGTTSVGLLDGYLGDGYGLPSDGSREALALLAKLEGILIDPVYTSKAMHALIDRIKSGEISGSERVLFWHTGGAQALHAYPESE